MRRIDLHDESGMALVMALFVLLVLTIGGVGIYQYTSANSTSNRLTQQKTSASALAESGLQQASSILNNPSNNALAPRNAPNKMPAMTTGTTTTFDFLPGKFTALLTTTDRGLTGDLSAKTLMDVISVSGSATSFMTQHGGGDCVGNTPAAVRFYFVSPSASGSSVGTPPAGFIPPMPAIPCRAPAVRPRLGA